MTATTNSFSADDTTTAFSCSQNCEDTELSTCNLPKNETFSYEHTYIQALFAKACKDTKYSKRISIGNLPSADYRIELKPNLFATIEIIAVPEENKYLIMPSNPNLDLQLVNQDGSLKKIGKSEFLKNDSWLEIGNVKVFLPKLRNPDDKIHPLESNADLLFEADRLVHIINELNDNFILKKPYQEKDLVSYIGRLNISLIQRVHEGVKEVKKEIIEAILSDLELNGKEEDLIENFLIHHFGTEEILDTWVKELDFKTMEVRVELIHNYAKCIKDLLERFIPIDKQHNSSRAKIKVYPNKLYENIIHCGKNKFNHIHQLNSINLATKHAFKVRGTYFSCTDFFEMDSNRVGTFSIISTKKNERVLRLFYLSNSHCCFRLLPAINHSRLMPKYDKAGNEVILAPPAEVQMNFAKILKNNKVIRNIDGKIFENGVPENYNQNDWLDYAEQTIQYPAKRSVQEIIDLIDPPSNSNLWREPGEIKITHIGETPNFYDLRGKYIINSKFLGNIKCYIFRSFNQEIEYIISRTKDNDIWFSSITSLKGPLNNFGVPKIGVDAHELTLSLYEYTLMMDQRYIGEKHPTKPSYSKVENYHSNITYLNDFRKMYIK